MFDFDFSRFPGLTDSKKLNQKDRERLFRLIEESSAQGKCFFASGSIDANTIDTLGIREANRLAMQSALHQVLGHISESEVGEILIDGRDNYHFEGIDNQKTRYIIG